MVDVGRVVPLVGQFLRHGHVAGEGDLDSRAPVAEVREGDDRLAADAQHLLHERLLAVDRLQRLRQDHAGEGPVGQGGCGAICISGGSPCYACFGVREDANIPALVTILKRLADKIEIERYFAMFYRNIPELQEKIKNLLT